MTNRLCVLLTGPVAVSRPHKCRALDAGVVPFSRELAIYLGVRVKSRSVKCDKWRRCRVGTPDIMPIRFMKDDLGRVRAHAQRRPSGSTNMCGNPPSALRRGDMLPGLTGHPAPCGTINHMWMTICAVTKIGFGSERGRYGASSTRDRPVPRYTPARLETKLISNRPLPTGTVIAVSDTRVGSGSVCQLLMIADSKHHLVGDRRPTGTAPSEDSGPLCQERGEMILGPPRQERDEERISAG